MKKLEIYLADVEYEALELKIKEYEQAIKDHQDDGEYTDQERTQIINAYGSVPFYATSGIRKQIDEMDTYIKKHEKTTKPENDMDLPDEIEYETESGSAEDFNFDLT